MTATERAPYSWAMTDPLTLAHRFAVPEQLPPCTAVTVLPHQAGLFFVSGKQELRTEPDHYLLTGSRIHSIPEAERILRECGEAVVTYHSQLTLFDLRPKLFPTQRIGLRAGGKSITASLVLTVRVADPRLLSGCGATWQPAGDAREIRLDDPLLTTRISAELQALTISLQQRADALSDQSAVERLLTHPATLTEARVLLDKPLQDMGLTAESVRLALSRASCPRCHKPLSPEEIDSKFCSNQDEEGNPKPGCGRRLHACPHCDSIVGLDAAVCPVCNHELLFCTSPGCSTFRRVKHDRFCVVCHLACYPLPDIDLIV